MIKLLVGLIHFLESASMIRHLGVRPERIKAFHNLGWKKQPSPQFPSTWFHASSLGELEMLTPLIEDFHEKGIPVGVSAFSDSALNGLKRWEGVACFAGLSPREGHWHEMLRHFRVERLIVSKYDLWPGLVLAAKQLQIPVLVINAEPRTSLISLKRIFKVSGTELPRLVFFANNEVKASGLQELFPEADVREGVDPRFERVARRLLRTAHSRLPFWRDQIMACPSPRGMVGSAWLQDLRVLVPAFKQVEGTLVVVPHDLQDESLQLMETYLESEIKGRYLIVNEMGLLTELYSVSDWVFVGGGFHKGIHSTIEPALNGVPVACGPKNFKRFSETDELEQLGILSLCHNTDEVLIWLKEKAHRSVKGDALQGKRTAYHALLEQCLKIR